MKTIIKSYLSYLFLCTFLFSNYETLLLVEFDNLDKNRRTDFLKHKIPDCFKNNNYVKETFNVEYAGKIEPYLNFQNHNYQNALLLIGDYKSNSNNFEIKINLIDMSNWSTFNSVILECNQFDSECVENSINGLIPKIFSKDSLPNQQNDRSSTKLEVFENIYNSIEDFVAEADFHYSWDELNKSGNQYGDRYYKNIDEDKKNDLIANNKIENTQKLLSFFEKILSNPYDVNIGEIKVDFSDVDEKSAIVSFPVAYSVKNSLIEDMLTTLPHEINTNSQGTVVIKFANKDYSFNDVLNQNYSLNNYQVVPVIFVTNKQGKLKDVYIDTWNHDEYSILLDSISENSEFYSNQNFYPLFAIMPGQKNMQINMDANTLNILYSIKIEAEYLQDFSKVAIKFIKENQIEKFIHLNN